MIIDFAKTDAAINACVGTMIGSAGFLSAQPDAANRCLERAWKAQAKGQEVARLRLMTWARVDIYRQRAGQHYRGADPAVTFVEEAPGEYVASDAMGADDALARWESIQILRTAVATVLSEEDQWILNTWAQGETKRAIAEVLVLTEAAIGARIKRSCQRIRTYLQEQGHSFLTLFCKGGVA